MTYVQEQKRTLYFGSRSKQISLFGVPQQKTANLDQSLVCTDHPSNRESVRPTVRPVLLRHRANFVLSATKSTLFVDTTKAWRPLLAFPPLEFLPPSIQSGVRPTGHPSRLTETHSKYCAECYDIYSIRSHYKGGGRWPPPQKMWRGLRPRHLFCGFLCSGYG